MKRRTRKVAIIGTGKASFLLTEQLKLHANIVTIDEAIGAFNELNITAKDTAELMESVAIKLKELPQKPKHNHERKPSKY